MLVRRRLELHPVHKLAISGILSGMSLSGAACLYYLYDRAGQGLSPLMLGLVLTLFFLGAMGLFVNLKMHRRLMKDAEHNFHIVSDKLKSVQDTIQDGLIVMSQDGLIRLVNRATERIFGYARDELITSPISIIMPSPIDEQHDEYVNRYIVTGEKKVIGRGREIVAVRKDGMQIPIYLTVNEFPSDSDKKERVFVAVLRDMTRLSESEARVEELSRRLLTVQEMERSQFSALIHDEVGQMLFAVKLSLQSLFSDIEKKNNIKSEQMDEILTYMTNVISDVRSISHSISPVRLSSLGLSKAIVELSENLTSRNKINIKLSIDHLDKFFPDGWDINVYRVVQEAIINAIKHGNPTEIEVRSFVNDDHLCIEIMDNGDGFLPEEKSASTGLGLSLMKQRALLLEGSLSIKSSSGNGTRVLLTVYSGEVQ